MALPGGVYEVARGVGTRWQNLLFSSRDPEHPETISAVAIRVTMTNAVTFMVVDSG
jgi:hypothetical protein